MSKIKTLILAVLTLSAGFMLSACKIEPLEDDEPIVLSGYVKYSDNQYLQYIVVQLFCTSSSTGPFITFTNSNGYFEFNDLPKGENWRLLFTDTDGSDNGGSFKQKEMFLFSLRESYSFNGSPNEPVKLEKNQ